MPLVVEPMSSSKNSDERKEDERKHRRVQNKIAGKAFGDGLLTGAPCKRSQRLSKVVDLGHLAEDLKTETDKGTSITDAVGTVTTRFGMDLAINATIARGLKGLRIFGIRFLPRTSLAIQLGLEVIQMFEPIAQVLKDATDALWQGGKDIYAHITGHKDNDDKDPPRPLGEPGPPEPLSGKPPDSHGSGYPTDHASGGVEISWSAEHRSVQGHESAALICFDPQSGLLFQQQLGQCSMAFADVEMASVLRWVRENGRSRKVAFSLDPTDPSSWHQAVDHQGLFQKKWYSHDSLKQMPVGYWMWRADWKLKQLTQGKLYDDKTGLQTDLRRGINVPSNFPEMEAERQGHCRYWIVCRKMILRPIGKHVVLVHPDDVQMGVERRNMTFDSKQNDFKDCTMPEEQHATEMSSYIDRNYDALAKFHPELLHCKRMAAMLAVAKWLLDSALHGQEAVDMTPDFAIPRDFEDNFVPALCAQHEKELTK